MPARTLLAVHAHPDDECIGTGGSLARYSAEGVRTILLTCTDGAVGEISDPSLATADNLVEVRAKELDEAVRLLGIHRLVKLGYRDSGMAGTEDNQHPASFLQSNFDESVERVVRVMRDERPEVVITYDENGGYGHPDHIRSHQVAVVAFAASGDAARYPDAGLPWAPPKLYYAVVGRGAVRRFADELREEGVEIPLPAVARGGEDEMTFGVTDDRITTVIDVSQYVEAKRKALAAHRTQMGPEQFFMRLPPPIFARIFGRETYQRVHGPTDVAGDGMETDLFAGL